MQEKIKISVIIPVYNVEEYLDEALLSVIRQSLDGFEVIIVNDGSTDSSSDIIDKYSSEYDYIKVVNQKNLGLSEARNTGLNWAQGEYIYFFDSDDLISENALETMYSEAVQSKLDLLLFGGSVFFDKSYNKTKNKVSFYYEKNKEYNGVNTGWETLYNLTVNEEYTPQSCLYLVNRNIIIDYDLAFKKNIIHEDLLFTFEMIIKCSRVKVIPDILFYRRVREGSIMTSSNNEKSFKSLFFIINQMLEIKDEEGISHSNSFTINKHISNAYGNALIKYILIDNKTKLSLKKEIHYLKLIGKENQFFKRLDYRLFYYSETLYRVLRKTFDFARKTF